MKCFNLLICCLFSSILYAQSYTLYPSAVAKRGVEVVSITGDTIKILSKKKIKIKRAFVFSLNNENDRFFVELIIDKKNENTWPVLYIDKNYYRCTGKGSSNGVYSVSFIVDQLQAENIAQALKVPCNMRKHFGHILTYKFIPVRDDYHVGDSVYVNFIVTNTGSIPVWYNHGGMYRNTNGRCDYFDFDVYLKGILLPDEGPEWNFGGEELYPELKPGESDTIVECISKWSNFKKAGRYTIQCSYRLHLQSEYNFKNYPDNQEDLHKAWDEKAEKTIEINIVE